MKKGSKHTEETKNKLRLISYKNGNIPPSRLGIVLTDDHKRKISLSMKKNGHIPPSAIGLKRSEKFKDKVSKNNARYWSGKIGDNAPNLS